MFTAASRQTTMRAYLFPTSTRISDAEKSSKTPFDWQSRVFIGTLVVTDTLQILPRIVLGTRATWPQEALVPNELTLSERGITGCMLFCVAKGLQQAGVLGGAALGGTASAAAALLGRQTHGWADAVAWKGWQLGTLVGTVVIGVGELTRLLFLGIGLTMETTLGTAGGTIGNLLDQMEDLMTKSTPSGCVIS